LRILMKIKMKNLKKHSNTEIGIAGEHSVMIELINRGFIAAMTEKNTESVDILCADPQTMKACSIQVKTTEGKRNSNFMLGAKCEKKKEDYLFFVFVNLSDKKSFYIVPSKDVAKIISQRHKKWLSAPSKSGKKHKDTAIRIFSPDSKYANNWELIENFLKRA